MSLLELLNRFLKYIDSSPELAFAKNTIKRVFVFLIIALSAVGLNSIVELLKVRGVRSWITGALSGAEFILVVADVLWFIKPLLLEIVETTKAIFRGAPVILTIGVSLAFVAWVLSSPAALSLFTSIVGVMVQFTGIAQK